MVRLEGIYRYWTSYRVLTLTEYFSAHPCILYTVLYKYKYQLQFNWLLLALLENTLTVRRNSWNAIGVKLYFPGNLLEGEIRLGELPLLLPQLLRTGRQLEPETKSRLYIFMIFCLVKLPLLLLQQLRTGRQLEPSAAASAAALHRLAAGAGK